MIELKKKKKFFHLKHFYAIKELRIYLISLQNRMQNYGVTEESPVSRSYLRNVSSSRIFPNLLRFFRLPASSFPPIAFVDMQSFAPPFFQLFHPDSCFPMVIPLAYRRVLILMGFCSSDCTRNRTHFSTFPNYNYLTPLPPHLPLCRNRSE